MLWQNVRKTDTKVFPSHAAYRRYADYAADSSVKLVQNVFNQYADAQKSLDYSAIYNVARNTFDKLPSGDLKRIFRTAIHHVIQNDPRFVQSGYEIQYIEPNSSGSSASPSSNSNDPNLAKIMHDYAHNLAEDRDGDEQNERPPKLQTRQETGEQTTQTTSPEGAESLAEQRRQAKARAEKRVHEITALHNLCDAVLNFVIQAHEVSMQDAFTKLHNQLTGKHVPVVYALAGKFYTTHEMGLKIGRSTNIEQRLTLYEKTLAQPSASNLWSSHTVVQGFALFSADDFENGLTVAYINSHIRETWYPVEAIFRVLFQLEFSAYNAKGEGGRMREWFDFESKERLFDRARKLFELISKTISHTNSWLAKTPNQLRTEINKCNTVEQWLNQQYQG